MVAAEKFGSPNSSLDQGENQDHPQVVVTETPCETIKQQSLVGFRDLEVKRNSALPKQQFGAFKQTLSSHISS